MITTRDLSLIRVRPVVPVVPVAPDAPARVPAATPVATTSAAGGPDIVAGAPEGGVEILSRS